MVTRWRSRERAYDGFVMHPDLATLRPVPWQEEKVTRWPTWSGKTAGTWSPRRGPPCPAPQLPVGRHPSGRLQLLDEPAATGRLVTQSLQRRTANDLERPAAS